ncbi:hypothetical protein J19TS2_60300 [Cohnella xylanilytica]|nr:hypothetical protein J19TS2_60300 [Cohnella xylanilytica]
MSSFVIYNDLHKDWIDKVESNDMQPDVHSDMLDEIHKLSREEEQRYRLLMHYLRSINHKKGQRGFLRKLKIQWAAHQKNGDVQLFVYHDLESFQNIKK